MKIEIGEEKRVGLFYFEQFTFQPTPQFFVLNTLALLQCLVYELKNFLFPFERLVARNKETLNITKRIRYVTLVVQFNLNN